MTLTFNRENANCLAMNILINFMVLLLESAASSYEGSSRRVTARMRRGLRERVEDLQRYRAEKRYEALTMARKARRAHLLAVVMRMRAKQRAMIAEMAAKVRYRTAMESRIVAEDRARTTSARVAGPQSAVRWETPWLDLGLQ